MGERTGSGAMSGYLVRAFAPRWADKLAAVLPPALAADVIDLAEMHATETAHPSLSAAETRDAVELFEEQLGRFQELLRDLPGPVADALVMTCARLGDAGLL